MIEGSNVASELARLELFNDGDMYGLMIGSISSGRDVLEWTDGFIYVGEKDGHIDGKFAGLGVKIVLGLLLFIEVEK